MANNNRCIQINCCGGPANTASWKYNLQRILNGSDTADTGIIVNESLWNNVTVADNVYLPMPDESPEFATSNKWEKGIVKTLKGTSKVVEKGSFISNLITTATAAPTVLDALSNRLSGTDETSAVWNPWFSKVPTFDGITNGFQFSLKFEFALGQFGLWDAKNEVILPILNLIAPALPRKITSAFINGPGPNLIDIIMGLTKGTDGEDLDLGDKLQQLLLNNFEPFTFNIKLGSWVNIYNCLQTNASWKFSSEVDFFGYPVKGECTLQFGTLVPISLTSEAKGATSGYKKAVKFGGIW